MKVCIVVHDAYDVFANNTQGHMGGVEIQMKQMASWLAEQGHDVSVITWQLPGPNTVDNVTVHELGPQNAGIRFLRFFTLQPWRLFKAMAKADADVYFYNMCAHHAGVIALWTKLFNKCFVYSVSSDPGCELKPDKLATGIEKALYRFGVRHADAVICQTDMQQQRLKENYRKPAICLNMPARSMPAPDPAFQALRKARNMVLWVGRIHEIKAPWLFVALAKALPEFEFVMVGPQNCKDEEMSRWLAGNEELENFTYAGAKAADELSALYQQARLLCCTSISEGFPNTFLEAWHFGLPIVSTVDPDNLISQKGLGQIANTESLLASAITRLMTDEQKWQQASETCQQIFAERFETKAALKRFENVLKSPKNAVMRDYFDTLSGSWSGIYAGDANAITDINLQKRLDDIHALLAENQGTQQARLLDVGCGTGELLASLEAHGFEHAHGVDYSTQMLTVAKRIHPNIRVSQGDACALDFTDNSFQVLVSMGLLEYIEQASSALSEFYRVLAPNGVAIITVPNKGSLFRKLFKCDRFVARLLKKLLRRPVSATAWNYHKHWSLEEITKLLLENGFLVTQANYINYGFLSPNLEQAKWNIRFAAWCEQKLGAIWLKRILAHTLVLKIEKATVRDDKTAYQVHPKHSM